MAEVTGTLAKSIRPGFLLFLVVACLYTSRSAAKSPAKNTTSRHYFRWSVDYMFGSPDCTEKVVMGINGQFPGPTIRARAGDSVHVDLSNNLATEGVVIHWHGIRQFGTPWADGTASLSQCAIQPGETFSYKFKVDKSGTYFYHGHYGMQRSAGLYGLFIVDVAEGEREPFDYDGEFELLLSDWWHQSTLEMEVGLSSIPFRWVGEPQSLLLNGRGQYGCSVVPNLENGNSSSSLSPSPPPSPPSSPSPSPSPPQPPPPSCNFTAEHKDCSPQIFSVLPNKTYRLRLASVTSLASLNLAIRNHKMVVVEADGNYVQPFPVDDLDIYSGETYSVLITGDQNPNMNYWLSVGVRGRQPQTPNAVAVLNYLPTPPSNLPPLSPPPTPLWNNYTHSKSFSKRVLALMGSTPSPPKNYDRRIILLNTQNKIDGHIKWAVNNISLALPSTPYIGSMMFGLRSGFDHRNPPEKFPSSYDVMKPPPNPNSSYGSRVYTFRLNSTVDVILQNANALQENTSEIHPWHLHGHNFWVVGYGEGKFSNDDEKAFNLENPPLRNTVVIFPYGWTALRFVADNPGVWSFHCHIEPHLHMGMGVVFAEAVGSIRGIPSEAFACGSTVKMFMKKKYLN
ncbi:hypothetical protein Nepgr_012805 [Nepenthes gracilis]|uniref:L-ascorbate oxidase n=1 Tax=Nepenthes gracilis TaxID=150966 RepID=A0AAD3XNI4_NEPGR|nr:hypothetical protein Nepgr_012805 [Nepenthes gracilis]